MTVFLIRHGQTIANEQHLYCGSTDLPLSPAGLAELGELRYDIHPAARPSTWGRRILSPAECGGAMKHWRCCSAVSPMRS